MANKKLNQLVTKPSIASGDLFPIADATTGQLYKTTISDLGTAIGSGVSSVNGLVGAVVLDTDDIQELASPVNKWFTDLRARAAISVSSPLAYNSGTGLITIAQATGSANGYLSSTDWTTFNSKQAALSGTGFVKISGTTISYDNSTYLTTSAAATNYVPYTGATANVNLGLNYSLTAALIIKSGGTSTQFLKADGSIDTNTYLTTGSAASTYLPLSGGTISGDLTISSTNPRIYLTDTDNNPDYFISNTDGTFTIYDVTSSVSRFTLNGTAGTFGGNLTVGSIIKSGGTSAQFLKADGSVDSNSYALTSQLHNAVTIGTANGLTLSTQVLSLGLASSTANGALSSADWTTFNGKQNALSGTGFVKISGSTITYDNSTYLTTSSASSTYLPLAGGTLTGALFAISASFSGFVGFGGNTSPLAAIDVTGAGRFSSSVTASSHIVSGGTSSQFQKGDGSLDSNTYLTTSSASSTYLAKSGGTLTGALTITNANINLSNAYYLTARNNANTAFIGLIGRNTSDRVVIDPDGYGLTVGGAATFSSSVTAVTSGANSGFNTGALIAKSNGNNFRYTQIGYDNTSNYGWIQALEQGTAYTNLILNGAGGNVGIGTTNAANRFNVRGSNTNSQIELDNLSSGTNYILSYDRVASTYKDLLLTTTSGNNQLYLATSGNVGIGTTSPSGASGLALAINGGANQTRIALKNSTTGDAAGNGLQILLDAGSLDAAIENRENGHLRFATGGSERMRITSSGNVGIGTTSPTTYSLTGRHLELNDAGGGYAFYHCNTTNVKTFLATNESAGLSALFTFSNHPLTFGTNNTERMRITSGGELLWNITATTGAGLNPGGIAFRNNSGKYIQISTGVTTDAGLVYFYKSDGAGGVTNTGSITTSGNMTLYNVTSDYRLKQDLKSINGLELINKINIYNYEWKSDKTRMDGVLAHELQEVLPYAVYGKKDGDNLQQVDYSKIVPVMVQAIKDLKAELDTLKNK